MHSCGYGADVAGADALNAAGLALNLTVATLGNIVGGALIVALATGLSTPIRRPKATKP